jgi:hypothetical protein
MGAWGVGLYSSDFPLPLNLRIEALVKVAAR